jgi:hypothetical protein
MIVTAGEDLERGDGVYIKEGKHIKWSPLWMGELLRTKVRGHPAISENKLYFKCRSKVSNDLRSTLNIHTL